MNVKVGNLLFSFSIFLALGLGLLLLIFYPKSPPVDSLPKVTSVEQKRLRKQLQSEQKEETIEFTTKDSILYLPTHDSKRAQKVIVQINKAIEKNDRSEIRHAFHVAAYSRSSKNSEIQEAFRSFLNYPNLSIRFLAAKYLYLTGNKSGKPVLINLIKKSEPLIIDNIDYRILAAQTLAMYREQAAASAIIKLYESTKDGSLLSTLALLSTRLPGAEDFPYVGKENALTEYGLIGADNWIPEMRKTFETSKDFHSRLGSARSLAQMTGETKYLDYLIEVTRKALANAKTTKETLKAIKYIGSIDDPKASEILLEGLKSDSFEVVEHSVVNLIFNQSQGYEAVKKLILDELELANIKTFKLSEELKWNLIATISDYEVQQAAKAYSKRTQLFDWEYYVVERKDWPIYNWVDGYVVKLNSITR